MHQSFEIFDSTIGHTVNEVEAYDAERYDLDDAPDWRGSMTEADEIAERLAESTGHKFVLKR